MLIKAQDIEQVFSVECINQLAGACGLPTPIDLGKLREGICVAAHILVRETKLPNSNTISREIKSLHRAADRQHGQAVASLLQNLSPRTMELLESRASRLRTRLPVSKEVVHKQRGASACMKVARLCSMGGRYEEKGRLRPTGKRSRPPWRPLLYAPQSSTHFAKREAERNFIIWLKLAWLEAANQPPGETADPTKPGPFARFVKKCLKLVGAGHADAVGLINEIARRRRQERHRLARMRRRKRELSRNKS